MKDLYGETAKTGTPAKDEAKAGKTGGLNRAYRVLIKPLVTEKAATLSSGNIYVFAVAMGANKISVSEAIEEVYGIKPKKVRIINVAGKRVRFGRTVGQRKDWKKALVTLPAGKSINIYEGV